MKVTRKDYNAALKDLQLSNLNDIAKKNGVAHAMKIRLNACKTIIAYDLNG
jgi:hypothetical protein